MAALQPDTQSHAASLRGRRALVVGLGRFGGGVRLTQWLVQEGALVTVTDQADASTLSESVAAISGLPVALRLGAHNEGDLDSTDLVVINPAVHKATSAFFGEVVRRGVPWTTEMNLFCERCPATVIGVTGTYGKSTTCAMLHAAFEAGRRAGVVSYAAVHIGGNIGRSLLPDLPSMTGNDLVILEMSNAQLEDLPRVRWAPHVAVITNLFPHHLDRYNSFADYAQAKLNIVRDPTGRSRVVAGELYGEAEKLLAAALGGRRDRLMRIHPPAGKIELTVPGRHNQGNAACVLTVCDVMGLDERFARDALRNFRGLPHRLEFVGTWDGVDYYNDSKSTAPAATIVALEAMERPVVAIVGGQQKEVSLDDCAGALTERCRAVVCMGQSGPVFAKAILSRGRIPAHIVCGVAEAVPLARSLARSGDVVLFSPGAPSFDQYANFTERGRHFVEIVNAL
jgi:UDP-N-acetylmuramoylalanine--D-glutamate ligase